MAPRNQVTHSDIVSRDVFISHASEDKPHAEALAKELDAYAISYWLDKSEIGWGQGILNKIEAGLSSSQFVIVLISKAFLSKKWTLLELDKALKREARQNQQYILPVIIDDGDLEKAGYTALASRRLIHWNAGPKEIAKMVADVMGIEFKHSWIFNHPEEYVGPIWIKMRSSLERSGQRHTFTIKWGPWTRGGAKILHNDRAIALIHSKGADGLSLPIRLDIEPECFVAFGQGYPKNVECFDMNSWWTQFEDRFRLWFARKFLWSR